jgi:2-polyprenyl-6-methoxyphenol hydroxylase-like FAD-dependent oxidoreductase
VTMTSQVLVVGAGPVGLTLAAELKRYGVSVRIVDKASSRTDKSKALVVWSRTLELLARAGCAEAFVAAGCKVVAVNLNAGGRPLGRVTFDAVDSPYPYALMLPQSDTERLLEEHGAALGVTVEREVELTTFVADGEGATAELRHADGRIETVRADWLVGCDGAHSAVRHGLGFTFEGDTLRSDWVLADVHLAGVPVPSSELAMYAHAEGVLALFPIAPGRYRVIADVGDAGAAPSTEPTLDEVQALLDRRGPGGIAASDPIWLSAFRINERKVKSYRAGRVFLAGDAAHVHSPAGGQGMNTGMQDAFNLAWKLAMAARGVAGERLLASYDAERSAVGDMVLRNAGRLTAAATLKNPLARMARNTVASLALGLAPVREAMANTFTEIEIGYPDSEINGPRRPGFTPDPGERVRPRAGEAAIGAGAQARFSLLAVASAETDALLKAYPALLDPVLRRPPRDDGVWLARPDGYVVAVAKSGEAEGDIGRWLRAFESGR